MRVLEKLYTASKDYLRVAEVSIFERPPLNYSVVERADKVKVGAELGPHIRSFFGRFA